MEAPPLTSLPAPAKRRLLLSATSVVPYCIGYFPADSLVVVGLHATARDVTIGPIARLDLADGAGAPGELLTETFAPILSYGLHACAVAIFSDVDADLGEDFVRILDGRLPVLGTVHVGRGDVRIADDEGGEERLARSAWEATPEVARMVVEGRTVAESTAQFRFPAPAHVAGESPDLTDAQMVRVWDDTRARVASPGLMRALARALRDTRRRDTVIASLITAPDVAPRFGAFDAKAINAAIIGGPRRTIGDLLPAIDVLALVAAHAGEDHHILTATAGYLAWYGGDGSRARVLIEQALAAAPADSLAALVRSALAVGMPPPWARAARDEFPSAS